MSLPFDIARCYGWTMPITCHGGNPCHQRDNCQRYTDRADVEGNHWLMVHAPDNCNDGCVLLIPVGTDCR